MYFMLRNGIEMTTDTEINMKKIPGFSLPI
jgi:hypothetical protein